MQVCICSVLFSVLEVPAPPSATILSVKQKLEDVEGVAVGDQEIRRVGIDGNTVSTLGDKQTLRGSGVKDGDTSMWAVRSICAHTSLPPN